MWRNPKETPNQLDDDYNGYIDDLHGIRFCLYGQPTLKGTLPDLAEHQKEWPHAQMQMTGIADLQATVDSPAAEQMRVFLADLKPLELAPFLERSRF